MDSVLINAFSLIIIIIAGYLLKLRGFFVHQDYLLLTRLIMNLTLPCALITAFAKFQMDFSLLIIIFMGFFLNIVLIGIGLLMAKEQSNDEKSFNMVNLAGYNIGCFTLPFVQTTVGAAGSIITSMFDIGNSIMATGCTYAWAAKYSSNQEQQTFKDFIKKISASIPFDVYMILLVISLAGIQLPDILCKIAAPIGNANAFLSMLLIGLLFECNLKPNQIRKVASILGTRLLAAVIFSCIVYYFMPFDMTVKHILIITLFAPMPILSTLFTEKLGGDVVLSGVCGSISIPISIIIMTSLLAYWSM